MKEVNNWENEAQSYAYKDRRVFIVDKNTAYSHTWMKNEIAEFLIYYGLLGID